MYFPRSSIALLLALAACASASGSGPPLKDVRLVVVYTIDTLRADRTSVYGDAGSTPVLDRLAAEGVVFDAYSAAAPWTLPSVPSMFTGRFACEHGVTTRGDKLAANVPVLGEHLSDAGWMTASFPQNAFAGRGAALDRGHAHNERVPFTGWAGGDALEWLEEQVQDGGGPWYVYVHTVEPHHPYSPPADLVPGGEVDGDRRDVNAKVRQRRFLERADFDQGLPRGSTDHTAEILALNGELADEADWVDTLYTAEVSWADRRLGQFVKGLEAIGVWKDTVLVVTSDHGEELWDHGGWEHNQSLYQELLHVPLVVRLPGGTSAGERVDVPVSGVDLAPTVLDLAGAEPLGGVEGRSLLLALLGTPPDPEPRVVSVRMNRAVWLGPRQALRGDDNVAVRDGRWKAIWNVDRSTVELYDLNADPGERRDLSGAQRRRAKEMATMASAWFDGCIGRQGAPERFIVKEDDETYEELKALGYID